jgi:RNA polymerase sigma-54 factor
MLSQKLQQRLLQKLSPQQIQFIKLLQVPTDMLESRIKQELEENPALEDGNFSTDKEVERNDDDSSDSKEESTSSDEVNLDVYMQDDDISMYNKYGGASPDDDEGGFIPIQVDQSLHELLEMQVGLQEFNEREVLIAIQIIGSVDDSGYLRREVEDIEDDLAFTQSFVANPGEVDHVLKAVQKFDPPGVASRNLQECLLKQLERKGPVDPKIALARRIVSDYMDSFTKKHYKSLEKTLKITNDELKLAIEEITRLNPRPGNIVGNNVGAGGGSIKHHQVIPDFIMTNNDGELRLGLNSKNAPELRVSKQYKEMFQAYDAAVKPDKRMKETVQFVKQKLDAAKWFIDAIRQRQQTLMNTMNAIMHLQYDYFLDGDETKLHPMILKDVADKIHMDISTVSRVANSKYVQTDFGIFLLKSFFSEGVQKEDGEEVSNKEVKRVLADVIAAEDKVKPLADDRLAAIMKEKGYSIARRTVAKYREQLDIPVARLRKEI